MGWWIAARAYRFRASKFSIRYKRLNAQRSCKSSSLKQAICRIVFGPNVSMASNSMQLSSSSIQLEMYRWQKSTSRPIGHPTRLTEPTQSNTMQTCPLVVVASKYWNRSRKAGSGRNTIWTAFPVEEIKVFEAHARFKGSCRPFVRGERHGQLLETLYVFDPVTVVNIHGLRPSYHFRCSRRRH